MRSYSFLVFYAGLMVLLYACRPSEPEFVVGEVDPRLEKYVAEFERVSHEFGDQPLDLVDEGVRIVLYDRDPETPKGVDDCWSQGHRTIVLDALGWNDLADNQRELLVFRQLGRCLLGRVPGDKPADLEGQEPRTLVTYGNSLFNYTGRRRAYYQRELFEPTLSFPVDLLASRDYVDAHDRELLLLFQDALRGRIPIRLDTLLAVEDDFELEFVLSNTGEDGGGHYLNLGSETDGFTLRANNWVNPSTGRRVSNLELAAYGSHGGTLKRFFLKTNEAWRHKMTIRKRGSELLFFVDEAFVLLQDDLGIPIRTLFSDDGGSDTPEPSIALREFRIQRLLD